MAEESAKILDELTPMHRRSGLVTLRTIVEPERPARGEAALAERAAGEVEALREAERARRVRMNRKAAEDPAEEGQGDLFAHIADPFAS